MTHCKEYIRDGRAPVPTKEVTSRIMSTIKAKNTKPELLLRKHLWHNGIRGYRIHWKKAPGSPDLTFVGKKIAVFVNGCYWHRCPFCNPPIPKSHSVFWMNKFKKNIQRDKEKIEQLKQKGWKTLTIWECQLKNDTLKFVDDIKLLLKIV